jgi:tetratricopeptide (TPR) repeat protein
MVINQFDLPVYEKPREEDLEFPNETDSENLALVAANPNHATAHFDLGLRFWGLEGKDSLAEYHLYQAVAAQPSFPEARRALGQLLQAQGRFGEAEIHFLKNTQTLPDSLYCWDDLALLYFEWNRPARLEATWRAQLKHFPQQQRTLRNLGLLLEQQGRYVEVERIYLEYLYDQKDTLHGFEQLENHYLRSLMRYPDSIRFHQGLAELYYQYIFIQPIDWKHLDDADPAGFPKYLARESIRHFLVVLEKRPDHPALGQLSYQLGHLHLFTDQPQKAIPWLEQAAELLKEKTDALFELADALVVSHRPLAALDSLESLAAGPGLDYRREVLLARFLALEGRLDEALALTDSIIAYYPNSRTPEAYRVKAFALERKGDASGAYEALKEAIAVDYASATDYYQIARLYFFDGPKENGLIWLEGALEKGLDRRIITHDPALSDLADWDEIQEVLRNYGLTLLKN